MTFGCSYSSSYSGVILSWYRQYPGRAPQYVLGRGAKGSKGYNHNAAFARVRFSSQADDSSTVLRIAALERGDTAVYYCALSEARRSRLTGALYKNLPVSLEQLPHVSELLPALSRGDIPIPTID